LIHMMVSRFARRHVLAVPVFGVSINTLSMLGPGQDRLVVEQAMGLSKGAEDLKIEEGLAPKGRGTEGHERDIRLCGDCAVVAQCSSLRRSSGLSPGDFINNSQ